jgi:hypothetical protein
MPKQINIRLTDAAAYELTKQANAQMETPTGFATRVLLTALQAGMEDFPLSTCDHLGTRHCTDECFAS